MFIYTFGDIFGLLFIVIIVLFIRILYLLNIIYKFIKKRKIKELDKE